MDYLATFEDTRSVLEAEQILMRRKIPFETVPHSQYRREGCGLAILFSEQYLNQFNSAVGELNLKSKLVPIKSTNPSY